MFTSALRAIELDSERVDKDYKEIYQSEKRKKDEIQDLESRCFQKFAEKSGFQINVFHETKMSVFVLNNEIKSEIINFAKKNKNGNEQKPKWSWKTIRNVKKFVQAETRMFEMIEMQKNYKSFFFYLA